VFEFGQATKRGKTSFLVTNGLHPEKIKEIYKKRIMRTIQDILKEHDLNTLKGAYLKGANLSGADLSRANLSGANLSDTNLKNTILHGACLDKIACFEITTASSSIRSTLGVSAQPKSCPCPEAARLILPLEM
jgi:DNA polymerase/3'-5' exonuclease PolX